MLERLETDCGVSLIKIIQRATAKGLDQIYIDRFGPQTEPWFSVDDDSDGIPVSLPPCLLAIATDRRIGLIKPPAALQGFLCQRNGVLVGVPVRGVVAAVQNSPQACR